MFRYNTLHIDFDGGGLTYRVEVDIIMVDSKLITLSSDAIRSLIFYYPRLKNPTLENIARTLSMKVARYSFKTYPYTLTVKVKVVDKDSRNSSEMELSQEDLIVEQLSK